MIACVRCDPTFMGAQLAQWSGTADLLTSLHLPFRSVPFCTLILPRHSSAAQLSSFKKHRAQLAVAFHH